MQDTEDQEGQDQGHPEHQVDQEHVKVEVVLDRLPARPLGYGDSHQVGAVDEEQREEPEHEVEQLFQAWPHSRDIPLGPCSLAVG